MTTSWSLGELSAAPRVSPRRRGEGRARRLQGVSWLLGRVVVVGGRGLDPSSLIGLGRCRLGILLIGPSLLLVLLPCGPRDRERHSNVFVDCSGEDPVFFPQG